MHVFIINNNNIKSKFRKNINDMKLDSIDKFCSMPILYLISFLNVVDFIICN